MSVVECRLTWVAIWKVIWDEMVAIITRVLYEVFFWNRVSMDDSIEFLSESLKEMLGIWKVIEPVRIGLLSDVTMP